MDAIDDPQMQSEMAAIRQGQELVQAASDKDITRLRELLADGADINFRDVFGKTALLVAAKQGSLVCACLWLCVCACV